jgi:RNA polymerase sigma-70 factor (ECF subfamily)
MLAVCMAMIDDDNDKIKFENIVEKYERRLYRESFKILKSHELAEEAVWETFFRIANNFKKVYDLPVYKMEAYLIITIKRTSYQIYNKEKKYFENESLDDMEYTPDIGTFNEYDVSDLTKAVGELEEKYRTAITYFYYYGHNANETAALMGVSRNAVYKYLRKAEQLLLKELRGDSNE